MKPKFNQHKSSTSFRYVLGIEGVAPSMQNEICPVVNTVTPRPFYWMLFTWCYYDYYKNEEQMSKIYKNPSDYIKRVNYYTAIGALLNDRRTVNNFIGADTLSRITVFSSASFEYRDDYLQGLSTMRNYNAGVFDGARSMNLVLNQNVDTNEKYDKPMITPSGVRLAEAFDKVIAQTQYYQYYRMSDLPIPKSVLVELGNALLIDSSTLPECKAILKDYLFERKRRKKLKDSKDYLLYIYQDTGTKLENSVIGRRILYDNYSSRSLGNELPEELHEISTEWETVIGRHYMVIGLQMIFRYMTEILSEPMGLEDWIQECFANQNFSFSLDDNLVDVIDDQQFGFEEREKMIQKQRRSTDSESIDYAIRILLSVYNRFTDRTDLSETARYLLDYGRDDGSISMNQFFSIVEEYMERPIKEFIVFVMRNYIVRQHLDTAFEKMLANNVDGFFIEKFDQTYRRRYVFEYGFQGLRMEELNSVMNDLECF